MNAPAAPLISRLRAEIADLREKLAAAIRAIEIGQGESAATTGRETESLGHSDTSPVQSDSHQQNAAGQVLAGAAHTDHPMRHYDRTCPACNPDAPTLAELDKAATQGEWNLQHEETFVAGPLFGDKEAGFDWDWVVQELPTADAHTYLPEDYERHKANCRFIVALVNAYRSGKLREVGDGEVVVPREPTAEMCKAGQDAEPMAEHDAATVYRAMIAAKDAS